MALYFLPWLFQIFKTVQEKHPKNVNLEIKFNVNIYEERRGNMEHSLAAVQAGFPSLVTVCCISACTLNCMVQIFCSTAETEIGLLEVRIKPAAGLL